MEISHGIIIQLRGLSPFLFRAESMEETNATLQPMGEPCFEDCEG